MKQVIRVYTNAEFTKFRDFPIENERQANEFASRKGCGTERLAIS